MATTDFRLFPSDLPAREWLQFVSSGFTTPVSGMIFSSDQPPCCGVALGGVGTGSIDIQPTGVFGFCSAFPAPRRSAKDVMPFYRNAQLLAPFLGLAVGDRTWVLATQKYLDGGRITGCVEAYHPDGRHLEADPAFRELWSSDVPRAINVTPADEIRYFGHFPVADLEYVTDSPITVNMRAWSPFIPGDALNSNIPGAVFEIRIFNASPDPQSGCVAFSFPGPVNTEPPFEKFTRSVISDTDFSGILVTSKNESPQMSYALGVTDCGGRVRFGGGMETAEDAWSNISSKLPQTDESVGGSSVAVDFSLAPGGSQVVRVVLAWHAPNWRGAKFYDIRGFESPDENDPYQHPIRQEDGHIYEAMYATRFADAAAVAKTLAAGHELLLRRVLAWQEAVYTSDELPVWLRDCLVNNLNLIAKDSTWAAPDDTVGPWTREYGAFGLNECPRTCSIIGCIASNFYGDHPVAYFFPELERSQLRAYSENMRSDGAVPFLFPTGDVTRPAYKAMVGINGACFADLVDRLWLRTGDDGVLREFYASVKKNTAFTMEYLPGPDGVISLPIEGFGQEWWEYTALYGMVTHFGGVRLAQLRIAERMAIAADDPEFAARCREWLAQGTTAMEKYLWNGDNYLLYFDPKTGKKDDTIMSSQLDGDWMAFLHGLPPVFPDERALTALETIKQTCLTQYGPAGFASRVKGLDVGVYGTFLPEIHMIGMTYMYRGDPELGLDLSRRAMDDVVRVQGHGWDLPNMIFIENGKRFYGTDYYQNMMLWALPAAIEGKDLAAPCKPGGLVDRIISAANQK